MFSGLAPSYVSELLQPHTTARALRSSKELLLALPRWKLSAWGDNAFSVVAPKLWNRLPLQMKANNHLRNLKLCWRPIFFIFSVQSQPRKIIFLLNNLFCFVFTLISLLLYWFYLLIYLVYSLACLTFIIAYILYVLRVCWWYFLLIFVQRFAQLRLFNCAI